MRSRFNLSAVKKMSPMQFSGVILAVVAVGIGAVLWASAAVSPASTALTPSGEAMPTGNLNGWKMIFNDDFPTNVPIGGFSGCTSSTRTCSGLPADVRSKWWAYADGWKDTSKNGSYLPDQVLSINNGVMDAYIHTANGVHMVAAVLPILPGVTGSKGGQQYGRYAIRFKSDAIPNYKTAWLLWPDSEVWPRDGELDFPEGDLNKTIGGFIHFQNGTSGSDQVGFHTTQTYTSWHTAVIEWAPNSCKYILDGTVIGSSTTRIPNTAMHWVIQTETNLNGIVPSSTDAGHVQIDWVAAWSYSPGTVASTPSPTPTPTVSSAPTPSPTPTPVRLLGDINNSGKVDIFDLSLLLARWGTADGAADLNHDGTVNVFDLSTLLNNWGKSITAV